MKKLILASGSPRRRQLLTQVGLKHRVSPSNIDEKLNPRLQPKSQVEKLSLQKAQAVIHKHSDSIILAADTVVVLNGEILGKPTNKEHAFRMLKKLSGTEHTIITGFTIIDTETKKTITKSKESKVRIKQLTEKEIHAYLETEEYKDKAGSYAVQERGAAFVEDIQGDYFNIVGLPLHDVLKELKKFGITIF